MTSRHSRVARQAIPDLLLVYLALVACCAALAQRSAVLEDFEAGVDRWAARDSLQENENAPPALISFFRSDRVPEGGGKHSVFVLFHNGDNAWAALSLPVNGVDLARMKTTAVRFWLRADGRGQPLDVVLSAWPDEKTELRYGTTISLANRDWEQVTLPLEQFTRDGKPIGDDLQFVRQLEFRKSGSWESVSFRLDEIQALAGPVTPPVRPSTPPPVRPGTPSTATPGAHEHSLAVDFTGQGILPFRTSFGANYDLSADVEWTERLTKAAVALGPKIVRVSVPLPKDQEAEKQLLERLDAAVDQLLTLAATVMICIAPEFSADLDDKAVAEFAARLVHRYNVERRTKVVYWEIFDEPLLLTSEDLARAVGIFNRAAAQMKTLDRNIRVGGMSLAFAEEKQLNYIMTHANHLSFCSWHLYGTHHLGTSDRELMDAAVDGMTYGTPNQVTVQRAEELLRQAGLNAGLLFITESNANARKTDAGAAADPRLAQPFSAAWLAALAMTVGPQVDVILASHLVGDGWGVLDRQGNTGPGYWAVRLLMQYAPRGRWMCKLTGATRSLRAMALKDRDTQECVVILANLTDQPVEVGLRLRGLPQQAIGELTTINEACDGLTTTPLPIEPLRATGAGAGEFASLVPLGPYGVGVAHFHK